MKSYTRAKYRRIIHRYKTEIKHTAYILLIVFILTLGAVYHFSDSNKMIEATSAGESATLVVITPTPKPQTDKEMIYSLPYGDLVWKTYGHESTWGQHDGCQGRGVNGFGFGWTGKQYPCFDDLKTVAASVSAWFVKHIDCQGLTVRQSLCLYQSGNIKDNCDYADYSLSL
jgi:hypothetical protein